MGAMTTWVHNYLGAITNWVHNHLGAISLECLFVMAPRARLYGGAAARPPDRLLRRPVATFGAAVAAAVSSAAVAAAVAQLQPSTHTQAVMPLECWYRLPHWTVDADCRTGLLMPTAALDC